MAHKIALRALVVGLILGGVMTAVSARQWLHVRGRPVEHARVVAAVPTGDTEHCGKRNDREVLLLTWRSENPPPGLPARFTNEEGCQALRVGDASEVVRVIEDDGSVHVWDAPATNIGDVALATVVGLALGLVFGVLGTLLETGWRLLRWRWSARRGSGCGA